MYNLPQDVHQTSKTANFGPLRIGSSHVIIHRHRPVDGGDNWVQGMDSFLEREGIVSQFCGVDAAGCSCVKCTFDGVPCSFSFRIRDMTLVTGGASFANLSRGFGMALGIYNLPQNTGMTSSSANFGLLRNGSRVMIHKHRPVNGKDNWVPAMDEYVGREGIVRQFCGVDGTGCPCVKCSFDGVPCNYSFRIRDMTLLENFPISTFYNLPQGIHMPRENSSFGGLEEGDLVIVHRHREVEGEANWNEDMDEYIGCMGTVGPSSKFGFDGQGCPCVRLTFGDDAPSYGFRIRDLTLLGGDKKESVDPRFNLPQDTGLDVNQANYGPLVVGSRVLVSKHRAVNGVTNWVCDMDDFNEKEGVVIELAGVDCKGCPVVKCSFDGVAVPWLFRIRDLILQN